MFCSLLLGFGDSCFNTQLYSILGSIYAADSSPAFAMFKFMQSVATAIAFYYSNVAFLNTHIYILAAFGTAGTLSFCLIEWSIAKRDLEVTLKKNDAASGPIASSSASTVTVEVEPA